MFLSEWREFPSAPCLARKKMMTTRVSMLLKSRASLTCFRVCFVPGQAKDLSAPWIYIYMFNSLIRCSKNAAYKRTDWLRNDEVCAVKMIRARLDPRPLVTVFISRSSPWIPISDSLRTFSPFITYSSPQRAYGTAVVRSNKKLMCLMSDNRGGLN